MPYTVENETISSPEGRNALGDAARACGVGEGAAALLRSELGGAIMIMINSAMAGDVVAFREVMQALQSDELRQAGINILRTMSNNIQTTLYQFENHSSN